MKITSKLLSSCLALVVLSTAGCSSKPSDSEVENLLKTTSGGVITEVDDINCDSTEEKNTYLCSAKITASFMGHKRTDRDNFKISKVNDEWVLPR